MPNIKEAILFKGSNFKEFMGGNSKNSAIYLNLREIILTVSFVTLIIYDRKISIVNAILINCFKYLNIANFNFF